MLDHIILYYIISYYIRLTAFAGGTKAERLRRAARTSAAARTRKLRRRGFCVCMYMYVCMYIYIYIYTHIYMYIHVYIYIYIERERERERFVYVYAFMCLCVYVVYCLFIVCLCVACSVVFEQAERGALLPGGAWPGGVRKSLPHLAPLYIIYPPGPGLRAFDARAISAGGEGGECCGKQELARNLARVSGSMSPTGRASPERRSMWDAFLTFVSNKASGLRCQSRRSRPLPLPTDEGLLEAPHASVSPSCGADMFQRCVIDRLNALEAVWQ